MLDEYGEQDSKLCPSSLNKNADVLACKAVLHAGYQISSYEAIIWIDSVLDVILFGSFKLLVEKNAQYTT
jgi:hypothetical protein